MASLAALLSAVRRLLPSHQSRPSSLARAPRQHRQISFASPSSKLEQPTPLLRLSKVCRRSSFALRAEYLHTQLSAPTKGAPLPITKAPSAWSVHATALNSIHSRVLRLPLAQLRAHSPRSRSPLRAPGSWNFKRVPNFITGKTQKPGAVCAHEELQNCHRICSRCSGRWNDGDGFNKPNTFRYCLC